MPTNICKSFRYFIICLETARLLINQSPLLILGCHLYAMIMYWCGVTSIVHLSMISVERCITITTNNLSLASPGQKTPSRIYGFIALCWIYGLMWAILPLVGKLCTLEIFLSPTSLFFRSLDLCYIEPSEQLQLPWCKQ